MPSPVKKRSKASMPSDPAAAVSSGGATPEDRQGWASSSGRRAETVADSGPAEKRTDHDADARQRKRAQANADGADAIRGISDGTAQARR